MDTQITTPSKSHAPAQIGRWLLQNEIAEGAATLVYRVICSETQQDGVLKVFKVYADGHTLLQNEVQALELIHPNLPVLLDSGVSADGRYFLVTEYIQGPNLKEVLGRMGTLPPKDAVTIIERLASALDLAHSAGILHRDLKPSNIIIPDQMGLEGVALLDFSLAGTLEAQSQQTRAGEFFGQSTTMINVFRFVLLFLARAAGKFYRFSVQNTILQGSNSNFRDLKEIFSYPENFFIPLRHSEIAA